MDRGPQGILMKPDAINYFSDETKCCAIWNKVQQIQYHTYNKIKNTTTATVQVITMQLTQILT